MSAPAFWCAAMAVLAVMGGMVQGPATAQDAPDWIAPDWIAPDDFRDMTEGRVMLTLRTDGVTVFGHEQFLAGDRVIWQFPDGTCLSGRWQEVSGAVCCDDVGVPSRSCLRYRVKNGGLVGHQWDIDRAIGEWPQPSVRLRAANPVALVCGGVPIS